MGSGNRGFPWVSRGTLWGNFCVQKVGGFIEEYFEVMGREDPTTQQTFEGTLGDLRLKHFGKIWKMEWKEGKKQWIHAW